jgi:hypothetical protein
MGDHYGAEAHLLVLRILSSERERGGGRGEGGRNRNHQEEKVQEGGEGGGGGRELPREHVDLPLVHP